MTVCACDEFPFHREESSCTSDFRRGRFLFTECKRSQVNRFRVRTGTLWSHGYVVPLLLLTLSSLKFQTFLKPLKLKERSMSFHLGVEDIVYSERIKIRWKMK